MARGKKAHPAKSTRQRTGRRTISDGTKRNRILWKEVINGILERRPIRTAKFVDRLNEILLTLDRHSPKIRPVTWNHFTRFSPGWKDSGTIQTLEQKGTKTHLRVPADPLLANAIVWALDDSRCWSGASADEREREQAQLVELLGFGRDARPPETIRSRELEEVGWERIQDILANLSGDGRRIAVIFSSIGFAAKLAARGVVQCAAHGAPVVFVFGNDWAHNPPSTELRLLKIGLDRELRHNQNAEQAKANLFYIDQSELQRRPKIQTAFLRVGFIFELQEPLTGQPLLDDLRYAEPTQAWMHVITEIGKQDDPAAQRWFIVDSPRSIFNFLADVWDDLAGQTIRTFWEPVASKGNE